MADRPVKTRTPSFSLLCTRYSPSAIRRQHGADMATQSLEDRIRAIEDRLEIYNLIASHPPSADTGADYYTRTAYVEDGELDLGRGKATAGNETIAAVTKTPAHQAAIAGGLAHFAGLPRIEL